VSGRAASLGLLAVLVASLVVVAGASSDVAARARAKATGAPRYTGRLLGLGSTPSCGVGQDCLRPLRELRSDSTRPKLVASLPDTTVALSPDGRRAATSDGRLLEVGTDVSVGLPEYQQGSVLVTPDFSPDGARLAYATSAKVIVFDLATGGANVVLSTPCARYSLPDGAAVDRCGLVKWVHWLDNDRVFVWHYAGELPEQLSCDLSGFGSCAALNPQTYSVVDGGGNVGSAPSVGQMFEPETARGATVLMYSGWIDVNEVLAGNAPVHPLPAGVDPLDFGQKVFPCLSPDGGSVVHTRTGGRGKTTWNVLTLRSGDVRRLATTSRFVGYAGCAWSPDGQALAAVGGLYDVVLVPVTKARGAVVGRLRIDTPPPLVWVG
jgi:hypothetical protein